MLAHVRRHHPLLLNKTFGKVKVTSVRNPPSPAPIDSTGAGPSASTDSDVDPLTNLKASDAAPKHKIQMTLGEALKKKETYLTCTKLLKTTRNKRRLIIDSKPVSIPVFLCQNR